MNFSGGISCLEIATARTAQRSLAMTTWDWDNGIATVHMARC